MIQLRLILKTTFLILQFVFSATLAFSAEHDRQALYLTPDIEQYNLSPYIHYFRDPLKKLQIDDIVALDQRGKFTPLNKSNISLGVIPGSLWLRFDLSDQSINADKQPFRWLLDLDRPLEQKMELFIPSESGKWDTIQSCSETPCDDMARLRMGLFTLPVMTKAPKRYYLRIEAPTAMFFFPKILNEDAFRKKDNIRILVQGLYFGLAIAMILYSFSNFIFLKDMTYLWYTLYMIFMGLYFSVAYGLSIRFIHFLDIETLIRLDLICLALTTVVACQFTRSFLNTPINVPKMDRFIFAFMLMAMLLGVLASFMTIRVVLQFYTLMGALWPIVTIPPGFIVLRRGFQPALFILVGWILFTISVFLYSLSYDGRIPQNIWLFHAILIGSAVEILCFALALGQRFAVMGREKDALVVSRNYYQKASLYDKLTGVINRRGYDTNIKKAIFYAHENDQPLSLLMIDVDNFKKFNDSYGHDKGDIVLKSLGCLLIQTARKSDIACRYGGEEFAVILPVTTGEQAFKIAERLREKFYETDFPEIGDGKIHNSISIGATEIRPGDNAESLFKRADNALYSAKNEGRNQTVVATLPNFNKRNADG